MLGKKFILKGITKIVIIETLENRLVGNYNFVSNYSLNFFVVKFLCKQFKKNNSTNILNLPQQRSYVRYT
jgi:hypothetical protein